MRVGRAGTKANRLRNVPETFSGRSRHICGTFSRRLRIRCGTNADLLNLVSTKHALNSSRAARVSAPRLLSRQSRSPLQLQPNEPPGHRSRKARSFQLEIARLRQQGYSLDAIRAALAEAGMAVSRSTVHREATRLRVANSEQAVRTDAPVSQSALTALPLVRQPTLQPTPQQSLSAAAPPALYPAVSAPRTAPDVQAAVTNCVDRGRDTADRFMAGRITNPLVLARTRK